MSRPPNILRPIKTNTTFEEDVRAKMNLYLWSPVEGRVPHGAISKFLNGLVRKFFDEHPEIFTNDSLSRNE